jgi:hypothetical protein
MMGPYPNWVKFADNRCLAQVFARMHRRFDRISKPLHADSAIEEAQVTKRPRFLIIAVLLTFLDLAVVVCYGWPVWTTWSGDPWSRGILVLLAALGATSLANVWAQVVPAQDILLGSRSADREQSAVPIPVEARGQLDV